MMSAPVKPPKLEPDHVYVHITSSLAPSEIRAASVTPAQPLQLGYVGPVGELKHEYIFEVEQAGQAVKRDSTVWTEDGQALLKYVRGLQGVKAVEMMDFKKRGKRSTEL